MRIVGGRHRGRRLTPPRDAALRPTADRVREALFNILTHAGLATDGQAGLDGVAVLDACCGTGALGLEAISRGALSCIFLDITEPHLALARRNAETLGESGRCRFLRGDACRPPPAPYPCSLVFLDPPYRKGLVLPILAGLGAAGWYAPNALVVVETAADEPPLLEPKVPPPPLPPAAAPWKSERRVYGDTALTLLRLSATGSHSLLADIRRILSAEATARACRSKS